MIYDRISPQLGRRLAKKKKQKNLRDLSVLSTLHLHFSLSLCEFTKNAPKNGKNALFV